MRKKAFIRLAGVLLAALGVVALVMVWLSWGPWCGLTPLGYWLDRYGASPWDYKPCPKADEALRRAGTNAVPYLLRLLHSTNSIATAQALAARTTAPSLDYYYMHPPPPLLSRKERLMLWVQNHTGIRLYPPTHVFGVPPIRAHPHPVPASWNHWHAYLGFQVLGPLGRAAIPDLVKLAHDPDTSGNHYGNIGSLKRLDLVASQAANSGTYVAPGDSPYIVGATVLRDTQPFLVDGEIAAWSLAAIGKESLPPLLEMLDDHDPRLRARAAEALGLMGEAAEPAVPALAKSLKDSGLEFRVKAADALGWIGRRPDITVPALMQVLTNSQDLDGYYAAQSLGDFRERATSAIPALLVRFASRDNPYNDSAALALSKISRETTEKEVIPVLLRDLQLSRNNGGSGNMSLITLGQMKEEADLVMPAIIAATDDTTPMIRGNAAGILGDFGPAAKAAVPKLLRLTNDPDSWVRDQALRALQRIGPGP